MSACPDDDDDIYCTFSYSKFFEESNFDNILITQNCATSYRYSEKWTSKVARHFVKEKIEKTKSRAK